jgi:hypothetical protein
MDELTDEGTKGSNASLVEARFLREGKLDAGVEGCRLDNGFLELSVHHDFAYFSGLGQVEMTGFAVMCDLHTEVALGITEVFKVEGLVERPKEFAEFVIVRTKEEQIVHVHGDENAASAPKTWVTGRGDEIKLLEVLGESFKPASGGGS